MSLVQGISYFPVQEGMVFANSPLGSFLKLFLSWGKGAVSLNYAMCRLGLIKYRY